MLTAVASVEPDFTAPANSYFAESVSGVIKGLSPGSYDIGLCNAFGGSNIIYGLSSQTAIIAETPYARADVGRDWLLPHFS